MAREDGTHPLARSRSCHHTLGHVGAARRVPGVETVRCPKSRARSPVTVSVCSESWDVRPRVLSMHHLVLCRQNVHDTPLPFPRPVSHSTEQGLLFQHSFGDPLLASRLAFCVILESFLQSNNTHEHHNMLFFLCRTISILRSRHGKHCTTCILYEEAPETLNHRITLLSTLD